MDVNNNIQMQYTILLFSYAENIFFFLYIFDLTIKSTVRLRNFTAHYSAAAHRLGIPGLE
jgi:hypothetical protein